MSRLSAGKKSAAAAPVSAGGRGLRHVVLPPSVVRRAEGQVLSGGLVPTDAGVYVAAAGHQVRRPSGAAGAVLLVCTAGRGWVRWKGRRSEVEPGVVVLLPAGQAHAYGASAGEPWTLEWAHFTGEDSAAWVEALLAVSDGGCCLKLSVREARALALEQVYELLSEGYDPVRLVGAAAALRASLAGLLRARSHEGLEPTVGETIDSTAAWMREHCARRLSLAELARHACLSESHFSALFRKRLGYAPIDWLIRQRVQLACRLLDSGEQRIETVGRAAGFADPYYFSRCFKRVMAVSPRAYRAQAKG